MPALPAFHGMPGAGLPSARRAPIPVDRFLLGIGRSQTDRELAQRIDLAFGIGVRIPQGPGLTGFRPTSIEESEHSLRESPIFARNVQDSGGNSETGETSDHGLESMNSPIDWAQASLRMQVEQVS